MNLKGKVIKHWEENLEKALKEQLPDIRQGSCDYCRKYFNSVWPRSCNGCPILQATGEPFCRGTPYYRVSELSDVIFEYENRSKYAWNALIRSIEEEIEFLYSLPEDQEEIPDEPKK